MSSPVSNVGALPPIPQIDYYFVSAGEINDFPAGDMNNLGLLGNDREMAGGMAGGANLIVTGIGSSPDTISSNLSLISDYGQWTVQPNGAITYTANGLASKQLLESPLPDERHIANDMLYYRVVNQADPTATAAISQATMTIFGVYDPLEVSNGDTVDYYFSEDQWRFRIDQGNTHFFNQLVHVGYVDNAADLQATVGFVIHVNRPEMQDLFSAEMNNLAAQIKPSFGQTSDGLNIYFVPDFDITKADLDFLRPGDQITIEMNFTVGDGRTTQTFTSDITIEGVDHSLLAVEDIAEVPRGVWITPANSGSVLANDRDFDAPFDARVISVFSRNGSQAEAGAYLEGDYGTIVMSPEGYYSYIPNDDLYSRHYEVDVIDSFIYQIQNDAGETAFAWLDILVKPYPGLVLLDTTDSVINQVLVIDEDLQLSGINNSVTYGEFSTTTYAGLIFAYYTRDFDPSLSARLWSFSFDSYDRAAGNATATAAALSIAQTSLEISGPVKYGYDPDSGMWSSSFHLGFRMDHSFLFSDFNFLSQGDILRLDFWVQGDPGRRFQEGSNSFDIIYNKDIFVSIVINGENDAPVAADDSNFVYMGQTLDVPSEYYGVGLLDNDYDVDLGDELSVLFISGYVDANEVSPGAPAIIQGRFGTLTVYQNGSYIYQADAFSADASSGSGNGFGGTDIFSYVVTDTHGATDEKILSIYVLSPNDKPIVVDDVIVINLADWDINSPPPNVFANDTDYDPSRLTIAWTYGLPTQYFSLDEHGNILLNEAELRSLEAGESLGLSFFYTATNGTAESDVAYVEIDIIGSNETPVPENDAYFYENIAGSVFEVSQSDGLIFHQNIFGSNADADIDSDFLMVSAISIDTQHWINLTDGSAVLQLDENISVLVDADGSFVMDTSDAYRGMVSFSYLLSDGIHAAIGSAVVEVGGPAPQQGQLMINEISLDNPAVIRTAYTDNGSAPNRIPVGKGSIELLNASSLSIDATQLAKMKIEIVGAEGSAVTLIDLRHLTGLTEDANGNALDEFFIPAGGILMLYEPGSLGFGTWALYGPDKSFVIGGSGSYVGQDWLLDSTTKGAIAINLTQNDTSIDLFAANGADVSLLTGVIGLGDTQQDEESGPGVPWAGADIGTQAGVQYDGSISDMTDTVFSRVSLTDTNSERDWGNFSRLAMTIGDVNDKLTINVRNPDDPLDNMDPEQGIAGVVGQQKSVVSGSESGDSGPDILVGQSGDDTLAGGGGDDLQIGGGGADSIDGGPGGDNIHGGTGADLLTGGTGNDVFVYEAITHSTQWDTDVILDFENDQDWIDLSLIDADAATPDDQMFVWIGALSGRPEPDIAQGQVVYWMQNGLTYVQADVAGDDLPPLELMLSGVQPVSAADFVL